MKLNLRKTDNLEEISDYISSTINKELSLGKKVLWLVSGGSSIPVEVLISKKIDEKLSDKLVVTLVDERYGIVGHSDSNWFKLKESGFDIPKASMIPFLVDLGMSETTKRIKEILKEELSKAEFKIGIFGIGIDNHTAGILPHTEATKSEDVICAYDTDSYSRITITPQTIKTLDEAIVFAMGEDKCPVIKNLENEADVSSEPAQVLKSVPLLIIFTNCNI